MTAADYRARAEKALTPREGFNQPSRDQLRKADVLAKLAISASIDEATAAKTTIRSAIHHSH